MRISKGSVCLVLALLSPGLAAAQSTGPDHPGPSRPVPPTEPSHPIPPPDRPYPWPIDTHEANRAIAFGSALMVTQGDGDQREWKKVEVMSACSDNGSAPGYPHPGDAGPPAEQVGCTYSVHYVTHYQLVECADGRAYIVRSGVGVTVLSASKGWFFAWGEGAACSSTGQEPGPPPPPVPESETADLRSRDKDRPLDFSRITRSPL